MTAITIVRNVKDGRVLADHLTHPWTVQPGKTEPERGRYLPKVTASQRHSQD